MDRAQSYSLKIKYLYTIGDLYNYLEIYLYIIGDIIGDLYHYLEIYIIIIGDLLRYYWRYSLKIKYLYIIGDQ